MNYNAASSNYPQNTGRKLHKRPVEAPGFETTGYAPPPVQAPYNLYNPPGGMPQNNAIPNYSQQMPGPPFGAPTMPMGGYVGGYPNAPPVGVGGLGVGDPGLLANPIVTNVAMQYGSALVGSGKQLVDREFEKYVPVTRLKYYFAVDTSYVMRKLKLLFFPFTHSDWSVKYEQNEPVQPRYEVNAPDLYIPTMAYVTYVLVAGLVLGVQNRFTPEFLGIQASSALAWTIAEILIELVTLYITNIQTNLKTLDLLAFAGYKFVGIIFAVLVNLIFLKTGYYFALAYSSLALAFFLMRTLKWQVLADIESVQQPSPASYAPAVDNRAIGHKRRLYFLVSVAGIQPLLMWWLSSHLTS
ncbi:yip1d-interacting factor 1 [Lycorma delicatula]|uniref:yip1d-interacting factor 1 n=1 Tax=Lycorma delicatula TaxID=130591 RepID=UPI003F51A291